jgi:hypothetical protein
MVGGEQQGALVAPVQRVDGAADARRSGDLVAVDVERAAILLEGSRRHQVRLVVAADAGQQQAELVAADAGQCVALAWAGLQAQGEAPQEQVAGVVAPARR